MGGAPSADLSRDICAPLLPGDQRQLLLVGSFDGDGTDSWCQLPREEVLSGGG